MHQDTGNKLQVTTARAITPQHNITQEGREKETTDVPESVVSNSSLTDELTAVGQEHHDIGRNQASNSPVQEVDDKPTDRAEYSPASLWCRVQLLSHSELLKWKIYKCPHCSQGLGKPAQQQVPTSETKTIDASDANNETLKANKVEAVSRRARPRGSITGTTSLVPIVDFVTVVKTNHLPNYAQMYPMRLQRTDTEGILSDPKLTTEDVGKQVVINSKRIVDAFRDIVTYHPGLELIGASMTIPEPYFVFYHYLEEIKAYQETYSGSKEHQTKSDHSSLILAESMPCDEETHEHLAIFREVIE